MIQWAHILGIYAEKTMIQKDTCTPVLLQPVSSSQDMEQPICPLTDEWIKKMWHIYTMGYYLAIKRNKIRSFVSLFYRWENWGTMRLSSTWGCIAGKLQSQDSQPASLILEAMFKTTLKLCLSNNNNNNGGYCYYFE